jgi:hypothetical protein
MRKNKSVKSNISISKRLAKLMNLSIDNFSWSKVIDRFQYRLISVLNQL